MDRIWRGDDKKSELVSTFTIVIAVKWAHGSFPRNIPLRECRTPTSTCTGCIETVQLN